MASDADNSHPEDTTLGLSPAGRISKSFRRWLAVPVSDLIMLRHVLQRQVEKDGSAEAQALLHLVDAELIRRSASLVGIIPPGPTFGSEVPCPEAG
ncbi:hypothetical protein [Arthrobacter sp. HMWF013]|uniref:hypothetical protein n=1 Tax=Arthrobacter sp. HMWF013 TaxID=2056849 RepID=UPI000D3C76F3|nr:hypothetical protein [Arthrobacter sp. HMWF013]PTT68517.1 hypothetical protein DBR22_06435 [Arthrobacter sp. HMWF013]